jgi:hypothetical protein
MLYGDRGYCIAHARGRMRQAMGRHSRSGGADEHAKGKDGDVAGYLGLGGAGRGVSAVRPRRIRRDP